MTLRRVVQRLQKKKLGDEKVFSVIQGGDRGGPNHGGEKRSMLRDIWKTELIEIANGLECEMKKRE